MKRKVLIVFLAVMFVTLSGAAGFAEMNMGDYTLGGYIALGGGWLSDQPRHMDRGYLKEYLPFPQGFLAYTDLMLKSKDGLEYYRFFMSQPGLRDQDFLLQMGKLGVYHAEIEYDQLQHLYCTVNPFNDHIGIVLQRLRFSGYYMPTLNFTIFAEDQFLRRNGWQPGSYVASPTAGTGGPYAFSTYLRPINYKQNDMKVGVEYDQSNDQKPSDQKITFQSRVAYHLSTFDNGQADLARTPTNFVSLPPSNMANYITAEGALNLKSYMTRLTGSFSYGWLSQNDTVLNTAGTFNSPAGLGASTVTGMISGVTRPIAPLTLRYSYWAYNFDNNNLPSNILNAFSASNRILVPLEQYSYLRQTVTAGADYRVNSKLAFNLGYAWQGVDRTNGQGRTSSNSPQVGIRLFPTDWLNLSANYAYVARVGTDFLVRESEAEPGLPLTYKFYTGNLNRNTANVIAEVFPVNNVTLSVNFSIYNDNFLDSTYGIQSDRGWSGGVDVSWRPHDRVALSLGYDHQQLLTRELTVADKTINGETAVITGDLGPTLTTSDSYDTFIARADFKLIPKKLNLTTRASYSFSYSNFHNSTMTNLGEYYADIRTFLTYKFTEHWACRAGYIFEIFHLSDAYQTLYLTGLTNGGGTPNQQYNTLDGYYKNATAHVVQAFLQYKF